MLNLFTRLFDSNQKEINRLKLIVEKIKSFDRQVEKLKEEEFPEKTAEFKNRLSKGETLNDLLPEAFALVREAARRTIGERHFDVQLIAAIALHEGKVAEQKTGEGKTLSAVPALYLNSLTGKGVHLVTVNDYLARRDAGWMGTIFNLLGVTTAAMIHDESFIYDTNFENKDVVDWRLKHLKLTSRKEAYLADVTYGINSEFGFDYLRDNMVSDIARTVQRGFHYAIVDEVDSVLIDEARTPHIVSAPDTEPTKKYYEYAKLIDRLKSKVDYEIDEKHRTATLTENGILKVERLLGIENLYEKDFDTIHHIEAALKARTLYKIDRDYVVKDNQVIIVDEFTGRLLMGRRFSEGLHQAIEAKESVTIQHESKTMATVSLQNYFRMYEKLAGMTGTAATEAEEFHKIYKLEVLSIPTNKQVKRTDHPDMIYKTMRAKYAAVVADIAKRNEAGQPVLVGTTSIEHNEIISRFLKHKGVPHELLNAKNHEREAFIISQAGKKGAVTVATNMAGRGVDIILGGEPPNKYTTTDKKQYEKEHKQWQQKHDEVISLGGIHVIGTERHESRRIDNQLRGRSGRQGDPGSTQFFVSLEDDLMRIFGGEQVAALMTRFNIPEDQPLSHSIVSKALEQAQVKVEGFNFDTRKHLVEYDDVLNKHREIIYKFRREVLESENQNEGNNLKEQILAKINKEVTNIVGMYQAEGLNQTERENIVKGFATIIPFDDNSRNKLLDKLSELKTAEEVTKFLQTVAGDTYAQREKHYDLQIVRQLERFVSLNVIDELWMDHLTAIDDLREGVGLRGYGQRDPLVEYKKEAFSMFERLTSEIDTNIVGRIYRIQIQLSPDYQRQVTVDKQADMPAEKPVKLKNIEEPTTMERALGKARAFAGGIPVKAASPQSAQAAVSTAPRQKVGRNDPCPCGSGKKYKKCHYPQYG